MTYALHVVILSVPHTGTNLVQKILEDHGFTAAQWCRQPDVNSSYRTTHLTDLGATQRALLTGDPIIVPLRHPYRVEESWRRRTKDLNEGFFEAWDTLINRVLPADPLFLPVDVPDREHHLKILSETLGIELTTSWPLCGSKSGTHDLALKDTNPSDEVVDLAAEYDWFFSRFYPQPGCEHGSKRTEITGRSSGRQQ